MERKAPVDFLGCAGGRPVAFDVKEWSGDHWWLRRLEPHQAAFLRDWERSGGLAFVLLVDVGRLQITGRLLSLRSWEYDTYEQTQGRHRASLSAREIEGLPECPNRNGNPCDYLAALCEALKDPVTLEREEAAR